MSRLGPFCSPVLSMHPSIVLRCGIVRHGFGLLAGSPPIERAENGVQRCFTFEIRATRALFSCRNASYLHKGVLKYSAALGSSRPSWPSSIAFFFGALITRPASSNVTRRWVLLLCVMRQPRGPRRVAQLFPDWL